MKSKVCLNHIFIPEAQIKEEGVGVCKYCTPNEQENPMCKKYYPINVYKNERR